jgi:type III secretion protein V
VKLANGRIVDIALAALLLAVVVMMIAPLPTALLDMLLVANIAISALLLMAVVFSREPQRFTVFPTLLVLTTLFRVGLNVSTTRLILAHGDAGAMVNGLGQSAAASNIIVGLVVFAVITVVQMLVVARGAERVAEVSARFALDAMPGKQMAIDADLRNGAIDAATARERRTSVERESQFMGAMDGAMRFVKGDAIAAIVIVVINLLGGLVIGVAVRGMSAAAALQTYAVLSVGEGLLAQIPSLVSAVAAGILITRVAGAAGSTESLGVQLTTQLFGSLASLAATALVMVGLALMPGLPIIPFAAVAVLFGIGWWWLRRAPALPLSIIDGGRAARVVIVAPALRYRSLGSVASAQQSLLEIRRLVSESMGFSPTAIELRSATDDRAVIVIRVDGSDVGELATSASQWQQDAAQLLANHAADWFTIDDADDLLQRTKVQQPLLVRETVPSTCSLPVFTEICRRLLAEKVPLTSIAPVLVAIAASPGIEPGLRASGTAFDAVVEQIRSHMRRQISAQWAPKGQLVVLTLDSMIEDAVRQSVETQNNVTVLALEPDIATDIIGAVRQAISADGSPRIILTSGDIRLPLRSLLETELPDVTVLAAHELSPGTLVQSSGRISI